jgi:hypothetical protein
MSIKNHLKRAVKILRDKHEDEINGYCAESGQWTWNLKNWTIQFYKAEDYESVVAYRAKNELTNWSEYITLEARKAVWEELV